MAITNPTKQRLSSRYWLFTPTIGWSCQLADLAYQNDNLEAINQYCQQKNNEGHGFFAMLFESHTGYQCEWPMLNDDGKLISLDEDFQHCLKQLSELECTPYTIPLAHIDNELNRPLRNNIKKHLQKTFSKRYFVFVHHIGWSGLGMHDLMFTSDMASLPHLRLKARQACGPDMRVVIFDTEPDVDGANKFVEICEIT